jgi:hypothetical protein
MSTEQTHDVNTEQTPEEQKEHNVTGYIRFNKEDDLTTIFNTLFEFRKKYGLKYSHNRNFIYFSVKKNYLPEFAKVQQFRISHYKSKSEYTCSEDVANKLCEIRDSFLRIEKNNETGNVVFLSRTNDNTHNQLVYNVFKNNNEEFDSNKYRFLEQVKKNNNGEQVVKEYKQFKKTENSVKKHLLKTKTTVEDGFTKVVRNKAKYNNKKSQVRQATV